MLRIVVVVVAVAIGLAICCVIIGVLLPKRHVASRALSLHRTPDEVWSTIHDVDGYAAWRPGLKRVERLPDADGRPRWKEVGAHGAVTYEIVESLRPSKMVTRIADPTLPFGGTWTYLVEPAGDGSTVTITEHGEVYNPLFRFMSRFVFGHTATIDEYLAALRKRLGEGAGPQGT
jgi:Polyketide cyclase / dehydrase and lipid transport